MKKGVGIARVSTSRQEYERQISNLKKYSKENNISLEKIIEEKHSGSVESYNEREGFVELLVYLKKNTNIKIVIFDEISRLGRNSLESAFFYKELKKLGITEVHSIKQGVFNPTNSQDKLYFNILSSLSEYEVDLTKYRMISGKKQVLLENSNNTKNDIFFTVYGQRPYGYNLNKVLTENGVKIKRQSIEINKEESKHIYNMFKLIGEERKTITYVRSYLKNAKALTINLKENWSNSTIKKILKNKMYFGKGEYNFSNEKIIFNVPAIITEDLYNLTQNQLKENCNEKTRFKHLENFLLKNLLYIDINGKKRKIQTNIELSKIEKELEIRQYRNPERNIKNSFDENDFLQKRESFISVLDSDYIEKITLNYLKFLISKSNFFDKENLEEIKKLKRENELIELEKDLINIGKKIEKNKEKNFILYNKNIEIESTLKDLNDYDESKRILKMEFDLNKQTLDFNIKERLNLEDNINILKKQIENLQEENKKLDSLDDLKKGLNFIKKLELDKINKEKNIVNLRGKLLKYINYVEIKDNKENTEKFREFVKTLKIKNFYNSENYLLRQIFFSVFNRNKKLTLIKNSSYVIDLQIIFKNGIKSPVLTFVYYHKNPNFYFPITYEENIEKYGGDNNSKNDYRKIFESFQSFNVKY